MCNQQIINMNRFIKTIVFLITIGIMTSCNSPAGNKTETPKKDSVKVTPDEHSEHETLSLNNGNKWKADSVTNNNVKNLQNIIDNFNRRQDKSLTAYKNAAADLQSGLDKMISECKMQGPDHEALHKWLEPLIEKVKTLKQSSTKEDAVTTLEAIIVHLKLYTEYFE
jgi:CRISPR/Cas system CSM-associated protein Csm2 small subunit